MARFTLTVNAGTRIDSTGNFVLVPAVISCNNRDVLSPYGVPDTSGRVTIDLNPGKYYVEARNDRSSYARIVTIVDKDKTVRLLIQPVQPV